MKTRIGRLVLHLAVLCVFWGSHPAKAESDAVVTNPDFTAVAAKLDMGGTSFHYLNTRGALEPFFELAKPLAKIWPPAAGIADAIKSVLKTLGLSEITGFGCSTVDLKSGNQRKTAYLHLASRTGIFALAGPEPGKLATVDYVPADADYVLCGNVDPAGVIPLIQKTAQAALGGGGRAMTDGWIAEANKELDVDLEEAFASVGNEMSVYMQVSDSVSSETDESEITKFGTFVVRVAVKGDTFAKAVQKVISEKIDLTTESAVGKLATWRIDIPGKSMAENHIYIASGNGWYVVTNSLDELKRSEDAGNGKENILTAPELRKLAFGLPDAVNSFTYVSPKYVQYGEQQLDVVMEKLGAELGKDLKGADKVFAPTIRNLLKRYGGLSARLSWRVNDPNGIQCVTVGTGIASGGTMMVAAGVGIGAAIAVPSILRARENSRGRACQENLSKIDGAKEQYALEFKLSNGAIVSFKDLVNPGGAADGNGYLKKTPECPAGGTYTIGKIGEKPTCSIGDSNEPYESHELKH
ncbi:MAG: hypothetical protein K1X53_06245 [Candidatus Sumerlaeaceae bacterium]|nr:hypothetical protein [Candidatus Sumerlaeaceae bacterium]